VFFARGVFDVFQDPRPGRNIIMKGGKEGNFPGRARGHKTLTKQEGFVKKFISIALIAACLGLAVPMASMAGKEPVKVASVDVATININTATLKELQSLPGVGQVTAERIITYRTENGPFTTVDGLTKVKGIGKKSLEKIRELVSVE
jgi:competence protein ComEA